MHSHTHRYPGTPTHWLMIYAYTFKLESMDWERSERRRANCIDRHFRLFSSKILSAEWNECLWQCVCERAPCIHESILFNWDEQCYFICMESRRDRVEVRECKTARLPRLANFNLFIEFKVNVSIFQQKKPLNVCRSLLKFNTYFTSFGCSFGRICSGFSKRKIAPTQKWQKSELQQPSNVLQL